MGRLMIAAVAAGFALAPLNAAAQERAADAALGAVSGAVVLGPVGAVAGAVIGYTAGPSIARAWGLRPSNPPPVQRAAPRAKQAAAKPRSSSPATTGSVDTKSRVQAAAPASPQSNMPPVQALE